MDPGVMCVTTRWTETQRVWSVKSWTVEDLAMNPVIQRDWSLKTGWMILNVDVMIPLYGSVHLHPGDRLSVIMKWPKSTAQVWSFNWCKKVGKLHVCFSL